MPKSKPFRYTCELYVCRKCEPKLRTYQANRRWAKRAPWFGAAAGLLTLVAAIAIHVYGFAGGDIGDFITNSPTVWRYVILGAVLGGATCLLLLWFLRTEFKWVTGRQETDGSDDPITHAPKLRIGMPSKEYKKDFMDFRKRRGKYRRGK